MDPKRKFNRKITIGAISLLIVSLCALGFGKFAGFTAAEVGMQDWLSYHGRKAPLDTNRFEYVGVDKPTYVDRFFQIQDKIAAGNDATYDDHILAHICEKQMGAWSRSVWATFAERIMSAGAECLIIDVVFEADAERLKGDTNLAEVISKYAPRVIIGSTLQTEQENIWIKGPPLSIIPDELMDNSLNESVGLVSIFPEDDGIYRRGIYRFSEHDIYKMLWADKPEAEKMGDMGKETIYPSLSARAAMLAGNESNLPPVTVRPLIRFTGLPDTAFPMVSIARILDPVEYQSQFVEKGRLKDKIVLVGPHHNIFQDFHNTPLGVMRGPEYHLNLINAAITGEFIRETTFEQDFRIVLFTAILVFLTTVFMKNYILRFFLGLVLSLGYFYVVWIQYNDHNLLLGAVAVPLIIINSNNVITMAVQTIWAYADNQEFEATMGRYFSPAVMKEVRENPGSLDAQSASVTLLLTDLRNSTPLAERLGPQGMFQILNQIFEAQTDAIMDHEGQLEHFLGDQFLSYWGAPQEQPDGPNQALGAARDLIVAMEKVKGIQIEEVKKIFGYGVTLHCGSCLVGNKGSEKKMEYGLVGDTINEAARIEALTKHYQAQLLVSKEIFDQLKEPGRHRLIDRVIVKGKSEPVVLYELEQAKSLDNFDDIAAAFKEAFDEYSEGKFESAKGKAQKLVDEYDDGPSKVIVSRCTELIAEPRDDWEGVWKMESK